MLIAFTKDATILYENKYDSKRFDTPISLYSILEDEMEIAIQGRDQFNINQEVQLGFKTYVEEKQSYTISIRQLEGEIIEDVEVYLEDRLLQIITNISEESFTFNSGAIQQNDRFVLLFKEKALGITENGLEKISLYPNPVHNILTINSPTAAITSVEVFDIRGRVIMRNNINYQYSCNLDTKKLISAVYFVKIDTEKGTITKRVIKE